jgi:hypothetical protein
MTSKHRIVFSYGDDNHFPIMLGWGHNLKEKNMCMCDSSIIEQTDETIVVKKTMNIHDMDIELLVKYEVSFNNAGKKESKYSSAKLVAGNKEYNIPLYGSYLSLQIEKYCYDNIDVVRLPCNIFDTSYAGIN